MYTFIKVFCKKIYSYNFHIQIFNNLKVIDDLCSQSLADPRPGQPGQLPGLLAGRPGCIVGQKLGA
jgi:hypothetical protein